MEKLDILVCPTHSYTDNSIELVNLYLTFELYHKVDFDHKSKVSMKRAIYSKKY